MLQIVFNTWLLGSFWSTLPLCVNDVAVTVLPYSSIDHALWPFGQGDIPLVSQLVPFVRGCLVTWHFSYYCRYRWYIYHHSFYYYYYTLKWCTAQNVSAQHFAVTGIIFNVLVSRLCTPGRGAVQVGGTSFLQSFSS